MQNYTDMIIDKYKLNSKNYVIEIASNDGYLLKIFLKKKIPCLGIEPTESTAKQAIKLGVPVLKKFFSEKLAKKLSDKKKKLI